MTFAACTAARIGEVSGVRAGDIDRKTWTVRRQTTPGPGGLIDKGTKEKRARKVPIIDRTARAAGEAPQNGPYRDHLRRPAERPGMAV